MGPIVSLVSELDGFWETTAGYDVKLCSLELRSIYHSSPWMILLAQFPEALTLTSCSCGTACEPCIGARTWYGLGILKKNYCMLIASEGGACEGGACEGGALSMCACEGGAIFAAQEGLSRILLPRSRVPLGYPYLPLQVDRDIPSPNLPV